MKRFCLALLTGSVFALSGLTSCSAPYETAGSAPQSVVESDMAADSVYEQEIAQAPSSETQSAPTNADNVPVERAASERPQLIKRAHLSLSVESVEDGFGQVRSIVNAQQGDVLSMEDYGDRQRSVNFELRVPADRLDAALDDLAALGEVSNRSISSEDVSNQLVDLQARLANARKSEEALKDIMSRSGEISDVLEVSRELSNVRQEIEQMAAAQKSLQTQVRYSTITLSLESAIALSPQTPGFTTQLSSSWNAATHSVGGFTTSLLQIGLWLLAYSPYLLVTLVGAVLVQKVRTVRNG